MTKTKLSDALDSIIEHLGAAQMQRSPKDDRIIADHIDRALEAAKGARTASPPPPAVMPGREEIVRAIAAVIAGLDLTNIERARAAANEAAGAILSLSPQGDSDWQDLVDQMVAVLKDDGSLGESYRRERIAGILATTFNRGATYRRPHGDGWREIVERCAQVCDGAVAEQRKLAENDDRSNVQLYALRVAVIRSIDAVADAIRALPSPPRKTLDEWVDHMQRPSPPHASAQELPDGVTYSAEHDNFYKDGCGLGEGFWRNWKDQKHRFPAHVADKSGETS